MVDWSLKLRYFLSMTVQKDVAQWWLALSEHDQSGFLIVVTKSVFAAVVLRSLFKHESALAHGSIQWECFYWSPFWRHSLLTSKVFYFLHHKLWCLLLFHYFLVRYLLKWVIKEAGALSFSSQWNPQAASGFPSCSLTLWFRSPSSSWCTVTLRLGWSSTTMRRHLWLGAKAAQPQFTAGTRPDARCQWKPHNHLNCTLNLRDVFIMLWSSFNVHNQFLCLVR